MKLMALWSILAGLDIDAVLLEGQAALEWIRSLDASQLELAEKINRADSRRLMRLPVVVAPRQWPMDEIEASPIPAERLEWKDEAKAISIDLRLQAFGAYEQGKLVRWGPVSSGAKISPTPAGEYFLNWRAKRHVSTANREWILHWYFNFENLQGRALHAYEMPGFPASHSCIRLLNRDAQWVYEWGETWMLSENGREVLREGTKVRIEGSYEFEAPPPWRNEGLALKVQTIQ